MKNYLKFLTVIICCICALTSIAALNFTAGSTRVINHGSDSSIDNLSPFTWMIWVKFNSWPASNGWLIMKTTGVGADQKRIRTFTDSSFVLTIERATTASATRAAIGTLTRNVWYCLAVAYNSGGGAGEVINLYKGTMSAEMAEVSYQSQVDGSGAETTEATGNLYVGNNSTPNNSADCHIAAALIANVAMTLNQIEAQRLNPHVLEDGSVKMLCHYGLFGTGNQLDLSGNSNHGTVTGATQIDGHPQMMFPWSKARRTM